MRSTAEIGLFLLTSEGSSASNVRRIEALTGPEAVRHVRFHDRVLHEAADLLRAPARCRRHRRAAAEGARGREGPHDQRRGRRVLARLLRGPGRRAIVLTEVVEAPDVKALLDLADRVKGKLGESAAVVLGCAVDGRVHLVASVAPRRSSSAA